MNPPPAPPAPVNILVVDDRPAQLSAMEAILSDLGENVICVSSGADALRQLLERDFAVLLLDVNMPDMDGFETATLIRQRSRLRHIPIIFVTAGSDDTHALQGYSLGAVDYILTPVVPEVLRTKVRVFVELFRMTEQLKRQADQRVALAEERAARAVAEGASRRAAFLADAGKSMARSLDLESTLTSILQALVPDLADFAILRVLVSGDEIVRTLHRDPNPSTHAPGTVLLDAMDRSVRSLATQVIPGAPGSDAGSRRVACPLVARGTTLGALAVTVEDSRPSFGPAAVILIEELCGRAAIAIDNCLLYREIQSRDRRKDQYVAMLAHELRNPLAVISSALGILQQVGDREDPAERAREAIGRQLQNLTQLIDDLVDVARISTGKITLTRSTVNLGESAERCLRSFNAAGKSREHSVRTQCRDTWIDADPVRLDQILTNLMDNALKYTPEGGRVDIRVEPQGDDGIFEIADTGVGMPPDVLAHAFDLFFQADRPSDRSEGGLGIGLTLVRHLVELHGGSIEVASSGPGKGSRFTVRFPGAAAPMAAEDVRASVLEHETHPCRILIVEDNEDARETLKIFLALAGHDVHCAADGARGVEIAEDSDPDLILIDVGLPGMDGYEVARRLRARQKRSAFLVALSGYGQLEDRRKALEAGFDMYIVKPANPHQLSGVIASLQPRRQAGECPKESSIE
jgi:signal transduction histidine kinase/DNA-binding response OmpR family regulator